MTSPGQDLVGGLHDALASLFGHAAGWGGIFGIYLQSLVDPELDAEGAMDAFSRMVMTST